MLSRVCAQVADHCIAPLRQVLRASSAFATFLQACYRGRRARGAFLRLRAAAVALPALFIGQAVGLPLRRHVSPERFRVMVIVLLVLAAASAIASAVT